MWLFVSMGQVLSELSSDKSWGSKILFGSDMKFTDMRREVECN